MSRKTTEEGLDLASEFLSGGKSKELFEAVAYCLAPEIMARSAGHYFNCACPPPARSCLAMAGGLAQASFRFSGIPEFGNRYSEAGGSEAN